MLEKPATAYAFHRLFTDFDEMCAVIREWDLDFCQIERGRFQAEIFQFGCGSVHISEAKFGRKLHQLGAPPKGLRTFAILARPNIRINWRAKDIGGNDIMIFPPGADLNSVSDESFHVFTCSFPKEVLALASEQNGLAALDVLRRGQDVVRCSARSIFRLRRSLRQVAILMREYETNLEMTGIIDALYFQLPHDILIAVAESEGRGVTSENLRRREALERALLFISQRAQEAIKIRDICDYVCVSQRTLEYAFKERFGSTPKSFLLAYRLNKVRQELRRANPKSTKVADLANRWGFWHMGQFAADYRNYFCELPSDTLRGTFV